jgi:hypothetical protein
MDFQECLVKVELVQMGRHMEQEDEVDIMVDDEVEMEVLTLELQEEVLRSFRDIQER